MAICPLVRTNMVAIPPVALLFGHPYATAIIVSRGLNPSGIIATMGASVVIVFSNGSDCTDIFMCTRPDKSLQYLLANMCSPAARPLSTNPSTNGKAYSIGAPLFALLA